MEPPQTDPTPLFDFFRGSYGSELLTAAVSHLHVFERLEAGPKAWTMLRDELGLAERPMTVLTTALSAMGLLVRDNRGNLALTPLAREHLLPASPFNVSDYIGLGAESTGVLNLVQRLRSNQPAQVRQEDPGAGFIFREGLKSAMDETASARRLTLALAGRARNVAPCVAERAGLAGTQRLLDVGGGSGIYAIACLRQHPQLRAIVWDRAEVLKVAAELAELHGVADRLECVPGDMFADPVPPDCDAILLSNVLHDWDVPECRSLVNRCAAALPPGGRLLIHDVYLNDALDGPVALAFYSIALFVLTEGRAYSAGEYREWLEAAGLQPQSIVPTLIHCGILAGVKPDPG